MQKLVALSYNNCFGCMIGSEEDKSANDLALRCRNSVKNTSEPTKCLLQVADNIERVFDCNE